jgi:polysaccharide chain length determinant protein (PEP-CTERM system associated)
MQSRTQGSALELTWRLLGRRKWLATLVFFAAFSAAVSLVMGLPDIYRASATVLVNQEQVSETFARSSVTGEIEPRLHAVSQEILSRVRLQDLIARFDLYPKLRERSPPEALIERMRRDIRLERKQVEQQWGRGVTVAFTLSYQGWEPQTVAQVTNTLASFYVEENEKIRERQAAGTTELLKEQLEDVKTKLEAQERRVNEFKDRHIGELPEQQEANLATLERLNAQLRLNSENQIRAMERREKLREQSAGPGAPRAGGGADRTGDRLARLRQELAELRARFSDKYPDIVRVKSEIAALERGLERANEADMEEPPLRARNPGSRDELEALKQEEQNLRETIAMYQRRVENSPKREQDLQILTRDHVSIKELYASLLKRYEEARLAETLERQKGGQFRVLDSAIPPKEPAGPSRIRLMVMGLMLSLGFAAGAVVLAEQLDTSFHRVEELRTFANLPVLASIPRIVTAADAWRRRLRVSVVAVLAGLGLALIVRASYFLGQKGEQLVWLLAHRGA